MTPSTDNSTKAIKARIRRRAVILHTKAFSYMKARYGIRKFIMPKIVFYHEGSAFDKKYPEAYATAHPDDNAIYINTKWLKHGWFILTEILPHEMAHMALFCVNNCGHDMEWKKCAMYIGASGASVYIPPRSNQKKLMGVYTYTKDKNSVKVLGRPFEGNKSPVAGYYFSHKIKVVYCINKTTKDLVNKKDILLNID